MRFMVLMKANEESEAGVLPSNEILEAMGKFNEELVKAGVMIGGEGLHPSSKGVRIRFADGEASVTDGPFTETKELIAGFWILQVKSREEAIEWMKRMPRPAAGQGEGATIELRQVFETEEFAEVASPETLEREARLRAQIEGAQQ
jgi:hypothetical protein